MSALSVHLNREHPRQVDAPASFVADGSFDVAIENHGDGSHVHVRLDEGLSNVARVPDGNRYVDADATGQIRVDTRPVEEPVSGELTISVGYGATTGTVDLRVQPSRASGGGIDVDERLAQPQSADTTPPDPETIALLALAAVVLLVAVGVAVTIESSIVVAASAFVAIVTIVGVVVALS